ncbi:MAG: Ig-like domain-containing protein [Cyclobacteriaceae bacterium]
MTVSNLRIILLAALSIFSLEMAAQSTFTVTNTNDSGSGSLRQAIENANTNGDGLDIINFSEGVTGTILLNSQLPEITTGLTINGPGEEVLSVSGQNAHRIFFINSSRDVTINNLTLREGRAIGGNGGSGASGGGGGAGMGGAIFLEAGNLTLNFTSLISNVARGGNGGTYNNPSTAFGGAGGAGPLGAGGASTTEDGVNGGFGSGGSGGGLRFSGESRANGGNGGYGAGAGSVGSSGGGASGVGTAGVPGTFGGSTSNPVNGVVQSGGGGAGLGAAMFIYGGSAYLNTVTVLNNTTQAGGSGGSGASSGQAKASGIFHYSGSLTNNGVFVSGNNASNAASTASDNADFYSQTGLSLVESNPPVISKSLPVDGESNYQKADGLAIYMNENIFKTDGSAIVDADLSGIVTFKETDVAGANVLFTSSIVRNKITITPDSELTNGQTYYIAVDNLEDRYGNEMAAPETITFTVDGTAPVFTANPESGTTILGRSFAFTTDEAFFDVDGTEIEPSEYINIVKVRLDDAAGELVSTTITKDGNTLQVSLDESLPDQLYHVTLENIADANGNEITPQVFTYSRPAFAQAKIRVNPRDGSILSSRAIEVTFEEDYYVETAPGTFALFKTRSFGQSYTDAVLDLKLNDENGTDIIDKWSFNNDGDVLYILSNMERNSTYYLKIANLFTADQTPVEAVEVTFTTPDTFNPVAGGGYFVKDFRNNINSGSLGSQFSMEFIVQLNGGSRRQGLFQGWASDFSNRTLFWLNDDQLVLSILDGSGNVISNQSISSNTFDESALASSFQHVGFTHDNGTVVFYYNGQPVGSGTLDISSYSFSQTGTGYSSVAGDFGSVSLDPSGFMSVDEVRIWSTALSPQVVSDWHQVRMSDTHPNFDQCRNLWLFDESGGKLSWDSKNNEANHSFNPDPIRGVSNRFAVPEIQVSESDITLTSGDEIEFTAGNGGQLQKQFTITNTGTVDLNLLGEASVSDFEGRFEIDYSETDLLIVPGASTSFTVTFQSNDVRVYNTFLTIPNSSLDNVFEVALVGRGVSLSNGNWQPVGGKDALPVVRELWADDGDIYFVTTISSQNTVSKLIKATISPDGNLNYAEETTLPSIFNTGDYDLVGDNSGNFYSLTDPGNGTGIQVKNIITNQSESFLLETANDAIDGLLRVDRNGTVRFVHSYSDGGAYNEYGIKVQKGLPSTETITLTMEDLRTIFGTNIGSSIFAYSIDFDSNNQLFATVTTNSSYVLVLKYDPTTGWEHIGYDYNTIYVSGIYYYVNLIIDQNDNVHVGGIEQSRLRYHKFSPTGNLLEGEYSGVDGISSSFTSNASRQGNHLFGLGAANEPMFLFRGPSSSLGVSAAVYENGSFRLFNERYITGTDPEITSSPQLAIDRVTGRPFVSTDGSNGPSDLWTTQSIAPELTATINGQSIGSGNALPVQIGVGFEKELELIITNSGLTNLSLTGDPIVSFTGAQAGDLSFDISGVTSSFTIGEQVSIPITFAPRTVYTNQEVVVSIPNTTPAGKLEITLVLNALDDTNTGDWSVHTDIVDPPYTDVDMRIGKNNQPVYTFNTYQTIVYPSGPNAGVTIPYARLETYQEYSGHETFDPETLDENINLSTTYPLTDYFPQIQALVNPSNNLNHFAYGTINGSNISPILFASHPVSGLIRVEQANNRIGRADFEFDENGDPWFLLMDDPNGFLFLAKDGEENIFFSGTSRNSKDLDLEITPDFMYSMTQEFGQSLGYRSPRGMRSTDQGAVTFLGSSSNQLRNGNYSDETHNKDIELYDGNQYTAWIRSDGGIEFYENTTYVSNPGVSNVIDLQLQIHPDGTPYIAYIEDLGSNQFPVSVIKLVDGVWETVGEPRFSYSDYNDQHAGLTDAPTRPALRAAFQINDLGQLFVFYGDIYTVTEAPEAFNRPPTFTSTPGSEVDEDTEYVYNITASDIDLDALTISTVELPAWLTFTDNGDGTASISGTPTDEDAIAYSFSVVVSDGSLTTLQEIALTVNDLNTAPSYDQPVSTLTIDQDAALQSLELTGLTDGDLHLEQSLSFEVANDNEFLLSSLTATVNENGTGTLLYQPTTGESGVATITLTLLDDGTPQKSIAYDITITVNPVTDPNAIVVTNLNDSGEGSLRAAIESANENPDHSVIDLRFVNGTLALASSLPALASNMEIVGTDASPVTVSGENAHQVFFMESGQVTLRSFTVANGRNTGGNGGIGDGGGGGGAGFGGAIFLNDGDLIVDRMTFTGNQALGGAGANSSGVLGGEGGSSLFGSGGAGGTAIFEQPGGSGGNGPFFGTGGGGGGQGSLTAVGGLGGNGNFGGGAGGGGGTSSVNGSAGGSGTPGQFGGNGGIARFGGGGGGGAGLGGAIFARAGNLIISNSTFSSNSAAGGARGTNSGTIQTSQSTVGQGKGGAIFLYEEVAYKLIDVVYTGNNASSDLNTTGDDNNIYIGTDKGAPSILLSNSSIDENQSGPVVIGKLSTFTGNPADAFIYTINSSSLNVNDLEIDGDVLRYMGSGLDFETESSFNVQIESISASGTNLSNFSIAVNDLDDPATDFDLSGLSINEGLASGTTVASFTVTDVDGGDNIFILTEGYGDNTAFQIVGDALRASQAIDFETKSSFDIQVEMNAIVKQFQISVIDLNEAPVDITLSATHIAEDAPIGTVIGSLVTQDEDAGDSHTYQIASIFEIDGQVVVPFVIDGADLQINVAFDYETLPSLQVNIESTDANGLSFTKQFTILTTDVNEAPTGIEVDSERVNEEVPIGTFIGNITTIDQDAGDTHSYEVLTQIPYNGSLYEPVSIVNGEVLTAIPVDFEVLTSIDVQIRSTDSGGLTTIETITFYINDLAIINPGTDEVDWNDPTSWENGQLPDENTDVTLPGDFTLVIDEIQKVRNLVVQKNTTIEITNGGALAIYGDFSGEGELEQTREITGTSLGGYSIVGSPMTTTPDVSTLPIVVYEYDVNNGFIEKSSGPLESGRGYFLRESFSDGNPLDLALGGKPNTGDITVSVSSQGDTYNLLSNPYTAAISVVDFIDNNTNIDGTLYLWDDGGANTGGLRGGDYLAVNKMGIAGVFNTGGFSGGTGSGAFDMNIGSLQGFFVSALSDSDVTFSQDMQVTTSASNSVFFRVADEREKSLPQTVKLQLTNGDLTNIVLVGLAKGASEKFDRGYDSEKLVGNEEISFYTTRDDSQFSIEGLGLIDEGEEAVFDLAFELAEGDDYFINLTEAMNLGRNMQVFLYDRFEDKTYDLLDNSNIAFSATSGITSDRFQVIFRLKQAVLNEDKFDSDFSLRGNTRELFLHYPSESLEHVTIHDMLGRIIVDQQVQFFNGDGVIQVGLKPKHVYMITIRDQTIKFIVNQ